MSTIEINSQFEHVLNFVNQTNQPVFLTGKAGTGKTTLLKYIKENTIKQMAVVAPTGVAAINAGGSTIHSFFQFAFAPFLPVLNLEHQVDFSQTAAAAAQFKYNSLRLSIFRKLELLVIDEISMVRADLLDQIDFVLRSTRKKTHLPFGGVQVMFIGDMHQLPPVVNPEEWRLLNHIYQSPYFFDSLVFRNNPAVYIELEKIYRQSETAFIDILNKVRNNNLSLDDLETLNGHYRADLSQEFIQSNITLTTHNQKADEINQKLIGSLPDKAYTFKCKVEGIFNEKNYPADEQLTLKKGTRVMFLKNNPEKNYYNGKIGIVTYLSDSVIKVKCEEDHEEIEVNKEAWSNVSYKLNKETKVVEEEILGTFSQYPLRLAWAITIHKSQGLTFEKVIIDAAHSFSAGQVYVALSRCRSLAGLTLSSKINAETLFNDKKILNFSSENKQDQNAIDSIFKSSKNEYIKTVLIGLFDLTDIIYVRKDLAGLFQLYKTKVHASLTDWSEKFFSKLDALNEVSLKFKNQLSNLIAASTNVEHDEVVRKRLEQASAYFQNELEQINSLLKNIPFTTESKEAAEEINTELQSIFEQVFTKLALFKSSAYGFNLHEFLKAKLKIVYPVIRINIYENARNAKISGDISHPALYKKLLLLRDDICNDEQKPIYMVASNKTLKELTEFLPTTSDELMKISGFGEAKVEAFGDDFLTIIRDFMDEHALESNMQAKAPTKAKKTKKEASASSTSKAGEKKVSSSEQTFKLFKEGLSLDEISIMRGFTRATLESHLTPYVASGEINIDFLVSPEKQKTIMRALEKFDKAAGLNPIKSKLPADISFSEIKYVLALKMKEEG
ncbi:MAG: helix-turn-helix domain-containing protein [Bacteroidia bacterium]|nr:helix-turn-helix domain-containing protein [Bacteroidia bacterium]